ncbi:unnamed protein product [Camellia sinensis]
MFGSIEKDNSESCRVGKRKVGETDNDEDYQPLDDDEGLSSSSDNGEPFDSQVIEDIHMGPGRKTNRCAARLIASQTPREKRSTVDEDTLTLPRRLVTAQVNHSESTPKVSTQPIHLPALHTRPDQLSTSATQPDHLSSPCTVTNSGASIPQTFDFGDYNNDVDVRCIIDHKCQTLYSEWKSGLHIHYKSLKEDNVSDLKSQILYPCTKDDWEWMIDNLWETDDWKVKSENMMKARGCVKYNHTSGSRSFASRASIIVQGSKPTITKLFEDTHKRHRHGGVWINNTAEEHHATMVSKIVEQSQPSVTHPLSEEQISREVLGKRSVYLKGYGICKDSTSSSTHFEAPNSEVIVLQQQLVDQRQQLADQGKQLVDQAQNMSTMQTIIQMLVAKNGIDLANIPGLVPSNNVGEDASDVREDETSLGKVVERFQELFAKTKYKEAAELAAESPQGILRTSDTVAKFQSVPVQARQTPPLLQYFGTLLTRGKLNAFESLELSRLVVNQNKKNLLENWLAEDKLECSEELGDLVKTVDNDLALKIYIKARVTPKVVTAFAEKREFDKILIYSKQLVKLLWSNIVVVFTDPGSVPPNWRPVSDEERGETDPLTEAEFGGMSANLVNPRIRYCRKCNQLKPPRCHHCSVCEWEVCAKNGPSLCVGCQLCGGIELKPKKSPNRGASFWRRSIGIRFLITYLRIKAFFNQWLTKLTNNETLSLQHQVQAVALLVLQQYSSDTIQKMLLDVFLAISSLTNRKTRDQIMILNSKRFLDRLVSTLEEKKHHQVKLKEGLKDLFAKRMELQNSLTSLWPKQPLVSGAAIGLEGQLTVYNYNGGPCYRCLFPTPPPMTACQRCSDSGVLGIVPGIIGCHQALEAIKIASDVGEPLSRRMLLFDALTAQIRIVKIRGRILIVHYSDVHQSHSKASKVKCLGKFSHPNLVKLLGYCWEDDQLLLIYEYMQKGSLESHLFKRGLEPLSWKTRLNIAIGATQGLAFLHMTEKQVIYRNFKASNILLDGDFNAKVSDFGLAKLGPIYGNSQVTTRIIGTYGYAAPEYVAIGLRVLDMNRPKGEHNLIEWARPFLPDKRKLNKIMDPGLENHYPSKDAFQAVELILQCLESDPKNRPSMEEVLETLQQVNAIKMKPKGSKTGAKHTATAT